MTYIVLAKEIENKVINIFKELKIDIFNEFKSKTKFDMYNFDFYLFYKNLIDNYPYKEPLFLNKEEQKISNFQHQNYLFFKKIYETMSIEDETRYDPDEVESFLKELFLCFNTIIFLKEKVLTLDYKKYGFSDAYNMFYSIEAFIKVNFPLNDNRFVIKKFDDSLYIYENYICDSFRISKYDIKEKTMLCPFNFITLPFAAAKLKFVISGYYISNMTTLALYNYSIGYGNNRSEFLNYFDENLEIMFSELQREGDFSDDFVAKEFPILGVVKNIVPIIHSKFEIWYKSEIVNGDFVSYGLIDNRLAKINSEKLNNSIMNVFDNGNIEDFLSIFKIT